MDPKLQALAMIQASTGIGIGLIIGLGGPAHGVPRESGFDITVASEIMAILCLARDLQDFKARVERVIVAEKGDGTLVTARELRAAGAMAVLMKDAIKPNLVQTLEATPALVHGGPFGNIAHGCNSLIATRLGLKLGDTITVNILGRNVDAKIASLRKIDWESLAINFVMVFSPNTLAGAPHRALTTLELPKGTDPALEGKVIQALSERFPLVTAVKVGDIVAAAKELLTKVMTAIKATAGVTLLIGAAVLAGAVAAGQQQRKYLAVLYKTLGATRWRIVSAELLEFGLLGLATALLSVLVATITAWALCKWAFDVTFVFSPLAVLETVLLALALVLTVGALTTWRLLSVKAAPYLRTE